MQKYLICFAILLCQLPGFSQVNESSSENSSDLPFNLRGTYNVGFMMAHRESMKHIPKELAHGFELSFEKQGINKKDWEKLYNNPTVGLSFVATGSGNQDLLGTGFGINGYIQIPLVKTPKFQLHTSWGWGLGYLTKKFDPVNNYENNTIGSHLNLFASIKLSSEFYVHPQWAIVLGGTFHHWSNSAFKYPNLGLNLPNLNLGVVYKLRPEVKYTKLSKEEKKELRPEKKNEFLIMPSIGLKAYSKHDNRIYPAYTLEFNYSRLWSSFYKISAGIDLMYNTAYAQEIQQDAPEDKSKHAFQIGTSLIYHQTIGDFSIVFGPGFYILDQTLQQEGIYFRFGTRYAIKGRVVISTLLHTHGARADHFKIGVGYKFRK